MTVPLKGPGERLAQREVKIRDAMAFSQIFANGRRVSSRHVALVQMPAAAPGFGIAVVRRIGCAAKRNKAKRRLRDIVVRNTDLLPRSRKVVLLAKKGADRIKFTTLENEVCGLLSQAGGEDAKISR